MPALGRDREYIPLAETNIDWNLNPSSILSRCADYMTPRKEIAEAIVRVFAQQSRAMEQQIIFVRWSVPRRRSEHPAKMATGRAA